MRRCNIIPPPRGRDAHVPTPQVPPQKVHIWTMGYAMSRTVTQLGSTGGATPQQRYVEGMVQPCLAGALIRALTYLEPTTAGPGRSSHQVGAEMPVFLQERCLQQVTGA
ncbi:uncharacterized protein FTJAE_9640 [Fusarium tjaetaba]|uniref:Uncharacterized protein n=1 Tax=Fusarium tjaetaba TaxID=1567544 RepID=A0A8H5R4N9_9HYPO|nr:uncharacterized protein FTJAE_9640 [Fusarium tjaetaba]KAF5626475.1 hypothetical protein FTJAE_9640 [Fusarium tjaetaba]